MCARLVLPEKLMRQVWGCVKPAFDAAYDILKSPLSGKGDGCRGSGVLGARAFGIFARGGTNER